MFDFGNTLFLGNLVKRDVLSCSSNIKSFRYILVVTISARPLICFPHVADKTFVFVDTISCVNIV